jgi:hypothetical protein
LEKVLYYSLKATHGQFVICKSATFYFVLEADAQRILEIRDGKRERELSEYTGLQECYNILRKGIQN